MTESYVERPPVPGLAGVVRTVWIQRTGDEAYTQRHLPTGGVEIHFPIGGRPQLVGPLTGPQIEIIPAHTTLVGVRFHPGTAPPLPAVLDDLVDQRVGLADLWGSLDRLHERAGTPERALGALQAHLLGGGLDRCACGHDHSASYEPFLAGRNARFVQESRPRRT